jgi:hypothetical protein
MMRKIEVCIFCSALLLSLGRGGTACATLMETHLVAQIDEMTAPGSGGLRIGDTVSATFTYDDGGISHEWYVDGDPLRYYSASADFTLGQELYDWMSFYNVVPLDDTNGVYSLAEPDGTELDEFFRINHNQYNLITYNDLYGLFNGFHLDISYLSGRTRSYGRADLGGHLVSYTTNVIPEPASGLMLFLGVTGLGWWRKKAYF